MAVSSCALTATRPVQEMYDAEAAVKAAKELHAESLIPELYRAASENYFKAKREYRLKNFEKAKRYAIITRRLAEKAEFEAYRQGGATPDAIKPITPEGAVPDYEEAVDAADLYEPQLKETPPEEFEEEGSKKPVPEDPGVSYQEFMEQKEQERLKAEAEAQESKKKSEGKESKDSTEKAPQSPQGTLGPVFF